MNILQITPGAGGMYCGACLRDNALVGALRERGHLVTLLPLYLPMTLDEPEQTRGAPIFFGGLNVFLDEKFPLFRRLPTTFTRWLDSPHLLKGIGKFAIKTRPEQLGDLTISMLKGEEGNQARELDALIEWLKNHENHDVIHLSNALLLGLAPRLKRELGVPIVVTLQGEEGFLDRLPSESSAQAWELLRRQAQKIDHFISPSRYFAERMQRKMGFDPEHLSIVPSSIRSDDFAIAHPSKSTPLLGYFARMCQEKGLADLIEAFLILKKRKTCEDLRLKIGGGCSAQDQSFVVKLKDKLHNAGLMDFVEFHPNLNRHEKLHFFKDLSVFSVPARDEVFGMSIIEAMAAGVPVVLPHRAAFPEIIEATGGGILYKSDDSNALAEGIESLLVNPIQAQKLGKQGRSNVLDKYQLDGMAGQITAIYRALIGS